MADLLSTEMETYRSHKDELLGKAAGKFVLIKGDKILGTYESQTDAVNEGYKQLGVVPFLVKQIEEHDLPLHFFHDKLRSEKCHRLLHSLLRMASLQISWYCQQMP